MANVRKILYTCAILCMILTVAVAAALSFKFYSFNATVSEGDLGLFNLSGDSIPLEPATYTWDQAYEGKTYQFWCNNTGSVSLNVLLDVMPEDVMNCTITLDKTSFTLPIASGELITATVSDIAAGSTGISWRVSVGY